MQVRRIRALVLAAGLGTRLRPLTEQLPKPLLPVRGVPILGHTLTQLAAFGCEAAAVNLHYLGGPIRERFGGTYAGMPLTWSEEPEILGTLGALHPLKEFFAPADLVLLINGDSLCRWPLRKLVRRHLATEARATLLLASRPDPAEFGGGVGVDRAGSIQSFRPGDPERGEVVRRYVFAGAHMISPELLARVGPGKADIVRDLYCPMLEAGEQIAGVVSAGRWHDLGTPQRFLDATLDWARATGPERLWRRSWISPEASLGAGARVRSVSIEAGARVGEGARAERSILMPGARIGKGCVVRESILGFGAAVPPGTWVERRIIMPQLAGHAPGLDDSVVGGAVYTPFGSDHRDGKVERASPVCHHRCRDVLPPVPFSTMPADLTQFRLLVFDWDGTLMDSIGTIVACTQSAIRELELGELPEETIRNTIGLGLRETIEILSPGCGEELFGRILECYRKHWISTYRDAPFLFDGVPEMLRDLAEAGYLLAVATGKSRRGLDYALEQTGLRGLFQVTRTADESFSKPHPQMLLDILDELGKPADAVMIGDTTYDLEMARSARTHSVGVCSGGHEREELLRFEPIACLDQVVDLVPWLAERGIAVPA